MAACGYYPIYQVRIGTKPSFLSIYFLHQLSVACQPPVIHQALICQNDAIFEYQFLKDHYWQPILTLARRPGRSSFGYAVRAGAQAWPMMF
jgi:hypothetical protein